MNFNKLNKMVDYIEANLDKEIDYNELGKITNTNTFILERIFMFLTNMTIVEYIKKRRLSKAFEEIRNTDAKIIDIAFKYQYNSSPSFNRAFKQLFNITPTECRKKLGKYKIIPKINFEPYNKEYNLDYEIKELKTITLYCYHVTSTNNNDLLYKIRQLYKKVKSNGYYEKFNASGMFGVFYKKEELFHYYLGSKEKFENLEKFTINENNYVIFKLSSKEQQDIVDIEDKINKEWIPSTNYDVMANIKIELYKDDCCYIFLPIR